MNSGFFIRDNEYIKGKCDEVLTKLTKALASEEADPMSFAYVVAANTLNESNEHNSLEPAHTEFYNEVYNAIVDELQGEGASVSGVTFGSMLSYLDSIRFDGVAPVFEMRGVLNQNLLKDVEPVFSIWCQDKKLLPEKTIVARIAVDQLGGIKFNLLNTAWLTAKKATKTVSSKSKPAKATSKKRVAATARTKKG